MLRVVLAVWGVELAIMLAIQAFLRPAFGAVVPPSFWDLFDPFLLALVVAPVLHVAVLRPMQEQQARLARQSDELRIAAIAFESQTAMMLTDPSGTVLRINRALTELTGYEPHEIVGRNPRMLKSGRHDAEFYREMWRSLGETGAWQGEVWDRRKSGEIYPKWLAISAVRDTKGTITHFIAAQSELSERKNAEERIKNLAFFDQLTGLPNRTLVLDRLRLAVNASTRGGQWGAVLVADIDRFKILNDTVGREQGDAFLRFLSLRLPDCVRPGDTVGRSSGDEFMVVLTGLGTAERAAANRVEAAAERILAAVADQAGAPWGGGAVTASLGAALFCGDAIPAETLLRQADLGMRRAKDGGGARLHFFDPRMEVALQERSALEADLRTALREGHLVLHFQTQIAQGRLQGAEALVRWHHPTRGRVQPSEFIPLAEETGLILPLGNWVLDQACAQIAAWAARPETAELTLSVNVSAHQFAQDEFVDGVVAALARTGANPRRLKLELTESLLVSNVEVVVAKMAALKARGVSFSLDDFGTGYSSLAYLKRLPLDQVKIDRSFVLDVLTNPNDAAIVRTIVALAQTLGLEVIAEGVETEEQRDFLASSRCLAYQGYYFSRPVPIDEFEHLVRTSPEQGQGRA